MKNITNLFIYNSCLLLRISSCIHDIDHNATALFLLLLFPTDINECEQGSDGCDHNCTNTVGSYNCTCMDGYELESDSRTCTGT